MGLILNVTSTATRRRGAKLQLTLTARGKMRGRCASYADTEAPFGTRPRLSPVHLVPQLFPLGTPSPRERTARHPKPGGATFTQETEHQPEPMGSPGSLRAALCCMFALATDAFQLAPPGATTSQLSATSAALLVMREPDSRSRTREQLLPDLRAALDEVSLFIYKADRSRMRKPEAPSAECIEAFCAVQQKKVRRIARDIAGVRGGAGG